ncbi:MAG: Protein-S-isoprenylcysteine O-methyltransferase [Gemmatimonadetes bacterium]|nr:Protein-S-isoprenylcysteine O-methyltransferase [Gemmatimonadota bacterium]
MTQRRMAAGYFFVQAAAIVGWWALLITVPSTRPYFTIRSAPFATLGAFALGDLGLIALGSALVAVCHGRSWAGRAAWCVSGALLYATCYTVAAVVGGVSSPLGACLMVPASVASIMASTILSRDALADSLSHGSSA